jgi:hypothetical protein
LASYAHRPLIVEAYQTNVRIRVDTGSCVIEAKPGDWVVKHESGATEVLGPEVFAKRYRRSRSQKKRLPVVNLVAAMGARSEE